MFKRQEFVRHWDQQERMLAGRWPPNNDVLITSKRVSQITSSSQCDSLYHSDRRCHNYLNSRNTQTHHPLKVFELLKAAICLVISWLDNLPFSSQWNRRNWWAFSYDTMYTYFCILMAFSVSFPCSLSRISTLARMNAETFAFGIFKLQTLCNASPQVVFLACEGDKQREYSRKPVLLAFWLR